MDKLVLLSFLAYVCTMSSSENDLSKLYRHLMNGYEIDVRPAEKHDRPLNVTLGFSLTQIIDVDERNQILTTNAWINQNWLDIKLMWNPGDFSNITVMHFPYHRIWRPDVVLYNNADSHYATSIISTDVFVDYRGNVTWLAATIFRSSCKMNVRYYPFDKQDCLLKFASWAYDGTKINLILNSEEGDETNYMTSSEWQLLRIRAEKKQIVYSCCPESYPFIDIHMHIRRRSLFYVFILILPCALISLIALLGFWMPSDSGEKVTLGITTLLSMTVFHMFVAESMPPTSDTLPLIGMYYGATICIVSLSTAMTVFTLNIHHKGQRGQPVPSFARNFVFGIAARLVRFRIEPYDSIVENSHRIQRVGIVFWNRSIVNDLRERFSLNQISEFEPVHNQDKYVNGKVDLSASHERNPKQYQFLKILTKVQDLIEFTEIRLSEEDRQDAIKSEWQQVALIMDRFLLVAFILGTTFVTLMILFQQQLFAILF